jgi:hypothetical protein
MRLREPYRGYIVEADPMRRRGRWAARVVFEMREHGGSHFQEVPDDPFVLYDTKELAGRRSIQFGKAILDTRPAHEPS